jgi:hypothetical protein
MKAITVEPMKAGTARLEDIPEPDLRNGSVLVEAISTGPQKIEFFEVYFVSIFYNRRKNLQV